MHSSRYPKNGEESLKK